MYGEIDEWYVQFWCDRLLEESIEIELRDPIASSLGSIDTCGDNAEPFYPSNPIANAEQGYKTDLCYPLACYSSRGNDDTNWWEANFNMMHKVEIVQLLASDS